MAIRMIEGKIGSGKTFYAVNHVLKTYYKWDDELDKWVPKSTDRDVRIYTNIQNMKLGENLDEYVDRAGGLIQFFDNKYQETFCMNSNVIYIIDEAQSGKYFHRKFYNVGVFLFFQMHRHLGCDIYLITQDVRCLARELQELAGYNIKAVRRSHSIGNMFTYKFYSGEECFKTKRIKKDKKVFGMYRSMIVGEGEKIRSIPLKHILIFTTLIICADLMFKFLFVPVLQGMNRKQVHATPTKKQESKVVEEKNEVIKDGGYYKIIGIVDGLYVVKTPKGLKKVKIDMKNKKNINDEIKIENL